MMGPNQLEKHITSGCLQLGNNVNGILMYHFAFESSRQSKLTDYSSFRSYSG